MQADQNLPGAGVLGEGTGREIPGEGDDKPEKVGTVYKTSRLPRILQYRRKGPRNPGTAVH